MLDDERVIPRSDDINYVRHLERYRFAKNFVKNKEVFSIACGVGYGEYLLATEGKAKKVTGVDYSREAIRFAKENYKSGNLKFVIGEAHALNKFSDNSYDVIVSFETIEHLKDDVAFLKELKRLLRPGGILLISTPNKAYSYRSVISPRPLAWFHVREYREKEFISLLNKFFNRVKLYGQKLILKRSLANLPRYLFYRFAGKINKIEKDELSVKPYPEDHKLASCSFLAICYKDY